MLVLKLKSGLNISACSTLSVFYLTIINKNLYKGVISSSQNKKFLLQSEICTPNFESFETIRNLRFEFQKHKNEFCIVYCRTQKVTELAVKSSY